MKRFLIKFTIFFVFSEIILRFFWQPPDIDKRFTRDDFSWLRDNVVLNSMNYRDREYNLDNKAGNYRILTIGSSFNFGWYIKDVDNTYPKLLEKKLNQNFPEYKFDVINASRHGFSSSEQLSRLKNEAIWFHPNLVIGSVNLGEFYHKDKHLFVFPKYFNVINKLRIVKLVNSWKNVNFKNKFSETTDEFKSVTYDLLEMKKVTEENGSRFALIVFPELNPSSPNSLYDHKDYHLIIKKFANENKIQVIDPLKIYLEYEDKTKLIINPADPHPSEEAHKLISESIINQYNFSDELNSFRNIPKIRNSKVSKIGDLLVDYKHIRNIKSDNPSKSVVYFEKKNGTNIESKPLGLNKDRELDFLENKIKTVKSSTHPGWPGAIIEYNFKPKGSSIVFSTLYNYRVLGVKQLTGYYKNKSINSEVSDWIKPESVTINNGEVTILLNPSKNYYLYRVELIVDVIQIDIDTDGTIADITSSKFLETTQDIDSDKVVFSIDEVGSYATILTNNGTNIWAYINNKMVFAKNVSHIDGKLYLQFNNIINKGDKISLPIMQKYTGIENFSIEYE